MYRYISSKPGSIVFAALVDVNSTVTHSTRQTRVGTKNYGLPILSNEWVKYTPSRSLPVDCTEKCNALDTARTVRVKIIGPLADKTKILADWEETKRIVDASIANYMALEGFLEPQTVDFSAG